MKYLIKERVFSIGNKFNIMNEYEEIIYIAEEKLLTFGKKLSIFDKNGVEKVYIEQQLFKIFEEYHISRDGQNLGIIKKEFSLFIPKYNITSIYGDYTVEGDIIEYEFSIRKKGRLVANITKKFLSFTDTYVLDFSNDEDSEFILALVIVLDQIHHDYKN